MKDRGEIFLENLLATKNTANALRGLQRAETTRKEKITNESSLFSPACQHGRETEGSRARSRLVYTHTTRARTREREREEKRKNGCVRYAKQ